MSDRIEDIHSVVQKHYGAVASQSAGGVTATSTAKYFHNVASAFGYNDDEIEELRGANLGLSCGNPIATSNLQEGEVVVDLGSGAGMDIILAAHKVGPTGRAIGIDMTADMIKLATENAFKRGLVNVEFIHSKIESLPLPSDSVDCVISNCVLNLVPGDSKQTVLKEVHRVLKRGGRVSISDIVAKKALPEPIAQDAAAYVGCVAGAIDTVTYESHLLNAGFKEILILDSQADLNVYVNAYTTDNQTIPHVKTNTLLTSCCAPSQPDPKSISCNSSGTGCCAPSIVPKTSNNEPGDDTLLSNVVKSLGQYDLNEYLGSYKIYALKY